jgi:Fur family transcriptional regulator, peroxide stress response regulator
METTMDNLVVTLRNYGLQVTHQRLAVYQALRSSLNEHPDAEVIYREVKSRFPMISLATVYKILERFVEVGLIHKVTPMTEAARYDANLSTHDHLICLDCQRIDDVEGEDINQHIQIPAHGDFHIVKYQLVFQGYCPACRRTGER